MVIKTGQQIDNAFIISAINNKLADNPRLQRLHDYFNGKHDILLRHYPDITKPNNKIIVNFCKKIVEFLTAYIIGVPVRYKATQIILDTLFYNDEAQTTHDTVRNMNIFGLGCELLYTDGDGLPRFTSLDPRECIFITDDTIEANLIYFIRFYPNYDNTDLYNVVLYTDSDYIEYRLSRSISELQQVSKPTQHFFNDVPAIYYINNREYTGAFEGIISLQNAINTVMSDEVNDFESFVDAILVLNGLQGTQSEDIARMKQDRVIILDENSNAAWLIKNVNNSHIKELKESIIRKIHELGNIPDIENLGSFGSSGVALRFKLLHTELHAAQQERNILKGLQRRLELLYTVLKLTDPGIGDFTDVIINFERNFIMLSDDLLNQERIDLSLVERHMLSKEDFPHFNIRLSVCKYILNADITGINEGFNPVCHRTSLNIV